MRLDKKCRVIYNMPHQVEEHFDEATWKIVVWDVEADMRREKGVMRETVPDWVQLRRDVHEYRCFAGPCDYDDGHQCAMCVALQGQSKHFLAEPFGYGCPRCALRWHETCAIEFANFNDLAAPDFEDFVCPMCYVT